MECLIFFFEFVDDALQTFELSVQFSDALFVFLEMSLCCLIFFYRNVIIVLQCHVFAFS